MPTIDDLNKKIDTVVENQATTNGMLGATLPNLATKEEVKNMVNTHEFECMEKRKKSDRKIKMPSNLPRPTGFNGRARAVTMGGGIFGGGAGVALFLKWLVENFFN